MPIRYLPNILTIARIILAGLLIPFAGHTSLFYTMYLLCSFSDVLDGYIARKTGTQSQIGAKLDSVADLVLFTVITWLMISWYGDLIMKCLPLLLGVIVIRIINPIIAWLKYHMPVFLHSWGNKATGALVFLTPLFLEYFHSAVIENVVLGISMLAAIEEGIIHLTSPYPELNRRSLFIK